MPARRWRLRLRYDRHLKGQGEVNVRQFRLITLAHLEQAGAVAHIGGIGGIDSAAVNGAVRIDGTLATTPTCSTFTAPR